VTLTPTSSRFSQEQADALYIADALADAKGDIIAATAADVFARLAVGADNTLLTADAAASAGVKWAAFPCCRAFHSVDQAVTPSGTSVALALDSERFDTSGFHSTTVNNSRLTVPAGLGGRYLLGTSVQFEANATGLRQTSLRVNGSTGLAVNNCPNVGAVLGTRLASATLYNLAAGDFLEAFAMQESGGSLNAQAIGDFSPELWLIRVG
jgi:hypothetical protein